MKKSEYRKQILKLGKQVDYLVDKICYVDCPSDNMMTCPDYQSRQASLEKCRKCWYEDVDKQFEKVGGSDEKEGA
jgi:signal-transduction protein with cAMP-binding, CBS, and nucleotidyltransferase domain